MYWVLHVSGTSEDTRIPHALKYVSFLPVCNFGGLYIRSSPAGSRVSVLVTLEDAIITLMSNSVLIFIYS